MQHLRAAPARKLPPPLFALAALVALARWATRARLFYNWDSVQYALGVAHYDLRIHQPHPPGSFYYILLGRALDLFLHDPHLCLLVLSALASALSVIVLYALGAEVASPAGGWWAALLGAVSPLFWFYGSVGLNYVMDGLFAALVGYYCLRLWRGDESLRTAALAGAFLGAAGGFRPTTVAFLLPLWLLGMGRLLWGNSPRRHGDTEKKGRNEERESRKEGESRDKRLMEVGVSVGLFALLTAGWLVPTAAASGGFREYLRMTREMDHTLRATAVWAVPDPLAAVRYAGFTHRRCFESMLGIAWLLLPFAFLLVWKRDRPVPLAPLLFWGAWIVPPALFFLLVHFNMAGYSLVYAPAVMTLAAWVLGAATERWLGGAAGARHGSPAPPGRGPASGGDPVVAPPAHTTGPGGAGSERARRAAAVSAAAAIVAVANVGLFWFGFPRASPRLGQRAISRAEITQHDAYWTAARVYLQNFPPGGVRLLVPGTSTEGLRVAEALLPEHAADVYQVVGDVSSLPESIARQRFLHFCHAEDLLRNDRLTFAVLRTNDDRSYLRNSLAGAPLRVQPAPIGAGFLLARVLPPAAEQVRPTRPRSPAPRP